MKNSTALKRKLNFQGLAGYVFVYVSLFFGVWFLDGSGNGFLVILGWILGAFWLPKSMKNVIDFGIDFGTAQKWITDIGGDTVGPQTPRLRTP